MYKLIRKCKSREEAIKRSGLHVGQLVRIKSLATSGSGSGSVGDWTVHILDVEESEDDDDRDRPETKTSFDKA